MGTSSEDGDRLPSVNPINHDPDEVESLDAMKNVAQAGRLSRHFRRRYAWYQRRGEGEERVRRYSNAVARNPFLLVVNVQKDCFVGSISHAIGSLRDWRRLMTLFLFRIAVLLMKENKVICVNLQ